MSNRILASFLIAVTVSIPLALGGVLQSAPSAKTASRAASSKPLPTVFASALPQIKARTRIAVLLPSTFRFFEVSGPAKHAVVDEVTKQKYAISLYSQLGVGDSGFAAGFAANAKPKFDPAELGNTRAVKLSHGIRGFFRPVSCGGSCAPANLWWEQGGVLYTIQLELGDGWSEDYQQAAITAVADSAIDAGPR